MYKYINPLYYINTLTKDRSQSFFHVNKQQKTKHVQEWWPEQTDLTT